MNCAICKLPTGNIVGSVLPQCKCGWQAPQPPVTQRPWVGLTKEEVDSWELPDCPTVFEFVQFIEDKIKDKNI